ncbi:endo-1,4-beta-xylanase [Methylobacterium sp. E-045]|uniref:endo-1,4-beta-xylanase n=1 Tax=Methylobacterium sp. E-045 TaxID=2836575 RepID=UPI001FB879B8|nr:endo-1,4-beta-xylanase [Methylobacterium sp. E-045]MCJ2132195.1 endo-1,4-beta-xylanase [Methylobacterium sp. E-045]
MTRANMREAEGPGPRGPVLDRRLLCRALAGLGAEALPRVSKAASREPSLAALAAAKGVVFGMALTREQVQEAPALARVALAEAAMLVPGNELKWGAVEPAPGRFDFVDADALVDLARSHRMQSRGHALVWHEALPAWIGTSPTRAEMSGALSRHIGALCGRYAGRMHSWDVVNEVIEPSGERSDGLRRTPFLGALGEDYIARAFSLAAEADPDAILTLNDYDLERDTEWQARRRAAMLDLLNRLIRRGVPVRALGIQGHLDPAKGPLDPEIFRSFIRAVASLGLSVFITELDITDRLLPGDIAARDQAAAETTRDYLTAVLAEPSVRMVVTWGVSDAYSWVDGNRRTRRTDGLASRPHLYDGAFRPKPLRAAVADAFRSAPARPIAR